MNDKHPDYFEGIIQIRPESEEVEKWIENQINKKEGIWISKKLKVKGGIDYYISSQRFIRTIGNRIKKTFKGEVKTSRKLYSLDKQKSKRVYRVTLLFRLKPKEEDI